MNTNPSLPTPQAQPTVLEVVEALKKVIDPEIGLNLVDLGVVRDIRLEEGVVHLSFTPTSPMCPLVEVMTHGIQSAIRNISGVSRCEINMRSDPPWNPAMISAEGRKFLESLNPKI